MLFAIGAGDRVVASAASTSSRPRSRRSPRVGALLDPDLERILLSEARPRCRLRQSDRSADAARTREDPDVRLHATPGSPMSRHTIRDARQANRTSAKEARQLRRGHRAALDDLRRRVSAATEAADADLVFGRETSALRGIYASGGIGFIHDMVEAAGGENVFADVEAQAVQATTELILARRPEVILELRADRDRARRGAQRARRLDSSASVPGGPQRPRPHHRRPAHGHSRPARRRGHRADRRDAASGRDASEDSRLLEQRQRQRVDAARAAQRRHRTPRGTADDDQRGRRPRGHARRPPRVFFAPRPPPPACRSSTDPAAPSVLERGLRGAHGAGRCRRGRRGRLHARRVRRSVSRGCPALPGGSAGRHGPDAAVPALGPADRCAGARDDRRRPRRAHRPASIRACCPRTFAGRRFDARCCSELPPEPIRAASAANFTPASSQDRCSRAASMCERGEIVERDGFVFAISCSDTDLDSPRPL